MNKIFTLFCLSMLSCSSQAPDVKHEIPPIIDEEVKQEFAFTFDLPDNSQMLNEGYVNNCPKTLVECQPEYEFKFSGEIDFVSYDMTVMIDPYDHGFHPQTFVYATENSDGTINVFDNIDDEGSGSWITNATAIDASTGHSFLFVINFNLEDETIVKRVFREIMSGFRISYQ